MTPQEQMEVLEGFEQVRESRIKSLIDSVLMEDWSHAKRLSSFIIRDDELKGEVAIKMTREPGLSKDDIAAFVRTCTERLNAAETLARS